MGSQRVRQDWATNTFLLTYLAVSPQFTQRFSWPHSQGGQHHHWNSNYLLLNLWSREKRMQTQKPHSYPRSKCCPTQLCVRADRVPLLSTEACPQPHCEKETFDLEKWLTLCGTPVPSPQLPPPRIPAVHSLCGKGQAYMALTPPHVHLAPIWIDQEQPHGQTTVSESEPNYRHGHQWLWAPTQSSRPVWTEVGTSACQSQIQPELLESQIINNQRKPTL